METKKRDNTLDAVAGLLIIYMMLRHAFEWSGASTDSFYITSSQVLPFFMAWFFFKSGMFHKSIPFADCAKRGLNKLIIPFITYSIIGQILLCVIRYELGEFSFANDIVLSPVVSVLKEGSIGGNLPLWFLLSLFFTKCAVSLFDKKKHGNAVLFVACIAISGAGTIIVGYTDNVPRTLLSSAMGVVFYLTGYWLRKLQYRHTALLVALPVFILSVIFCPSYVDFRMGSVNSGYWAVFLVSSCSGIVIANNLFKWVPLQIPALTSIGRNSMYYYCAHWIVILAVCLASGFYINSTANYRELFLLLTAFTVVLPVYAYWVGLLKARHSIIGKLL